MNPMRLGIYQKEIRGGLWGRNLGQGGVSIRVYKKYIS